MRRRPVIGDSVIYCDHTGTDYHGLCTCDWGTCINILIVRAVGTGYEVASRTSVVDADRAFKSGSYWRFPDDPVVTFP